MRKTTINTIAPCFERWCQQFDNYWKNQPQKIWFWHYLGGLIGQIERKNISQIANNSSSLPNNAELLAEAICGYWGIENQLNWVLNLQFQDDDSRIIKDNTPENFPVIRQIAWNLLSQEKTVITGIKNQ